MFSILPKNERKNKNKNQPDRYGIDSILIPQVELFSFVFWKNLGYQKVLLKLTDLWTAMTHVSCSLLYEVLVSIYLFSILSLIPAVRYSRSLRNVTDYGRTMKPFFIEIPNLWAWADNLGN